MSQGAAEEISVEVNYLDKNTALPATFTFDGITVDIDPVHGLNDRLAEMQDSTIRQVLNDPQRWIDAYYKKHGNIEINSDEAKTLFDEYDIDPFANVGGVHEASAIIASLILAKRLRELPAESLVLATAGGGGSGKGFVLKGKDPKTGIPFIDKTKYGLIYDSVMKSVEGNNRVIEQIINAGHIPEIVAVFTPIEIAAIQNLRRSVNPKARRLVPLTILPNGHFNFQQTFAEQTEHYINDYKLTPQFFFNDGANLPTEITFAEFKALAYTDIEGVKEKTRQASYEELRTNPKRLQYDSRAEDALEGKSLSQLDTRTTGKVEAEPGGTIESGDSGSARGQSGSIRAGLPETKPEVTDSDYGTVDAPDEKPAPKPKQSSFDQTDLFGNKQTPKTEQAGLFGTSEIADVEIGYSPDNFDAARRAFGEKTSQFIDELSKSDDAKLSRTASEIKAHGKLVESKGSAARQIIEDVSDALELFRVAKEQNIPVSEVLTQPRLDGVTFSEKSQEFARAMEAGKFSSVFGNALSEAKTEETESSIGALKRIEDSYEHQIERASDVIAATAPIQIRSAENAQMSNGEKKARVAEVFGQLKNSKIFNKSGDFDITVTHNGLKHNKAFSSDVRKIILLDKLKDVLENAVLIRFEKPDPRKQSDTNIKGYVKLVVPVNFGSENTIVKITLQKDSQGKVFYDSNVSDLDIEKMPVDVSARREGTSSDKLTAIQQAYKDYTLNAFDVNKSDASLIIGSDGRPLTDISLKRAEGEHAPADFHEIKFAPVEDLLDGTFEQTRFGIKGDIKTMEFLRRVMEESDIRAGRKKLGSDAVEASFSGLFTDASDTNRISSTLRDIERRAKEGGRIKAFAGKLAGVQIGLRLKDCCKQ